MSDKEAEILEEDALKTELEEKCSCEESDKENCDCNKKHDDDDEADLEESLEDNIDEKKYDSDKDEEEMEDESEISEEAVIDIEAIAESLGLESADAITSLKEKIETVVAFNTNEAVTAETNRLKEEAASALETIKEEMEADMLVKVNAYATMAVNEWLEENTIEIKQEIEIDRNRRIVESMKTVLEENSVELDEDTQNIVSEMETGIDELTTENEILEETNSKYRTLLEAVAKEKEIDKYDLSESQKEKVAKIAADIPVNENMVERIKAIASLVLESKTKKTPAKENVKDISESFEDSFVAPEQIVNENNSDLTFDAFLSDLISDTK